MTRILTRRKTAWASKLQPDIIRGEPLNHNAAIEARYYDALKNLISRMQDETERHLRKLFTTEHADEYFSEDASIASQARILTNALRKKFDDLFASIAPRIAGRIVRDLNSHSSKSVHTSIQKLSGGLSLSTTSLEGQLTDILKASVSENVALIKSIPQKYLLGVQGSVMRSITTGNGLQELVPYLAKNKGVTLRRARMIARDQTRKAYNAINRGRLQNLGIESYGWLHSGGSNSPRPLHKNVLNGNIFRFDTPPIIDENSGERGIPGQLTLCGCTMIPVVKFGNKNDAS